MILFHQRKKKENHKCKSILHYWAALFLMLVKKGFFSECMCACKYKKKTLQVSKAPCRPHTLEVLLQRTTTPPLHPPPHTHTTTNLLKILHLQTQNQSLSKLVMVRQHNRKQGREAASVIYKNDWNDEHVPIKTRRGEKALERVDLHITSTDISVEEKKKKFTDLIISLLFLFSSSVLTSFIRFRWFWFPILHHTLVQ